MAVSLEPLKLMKTFRHFIFKFLISRQKSGEYVSH